MDRPLFEKLLADLQKASDDQEAAAAAGAAASADSQAAAAAAAAASGAASGAAWVGRGVVAGVCIQFPDPWAKAKHRRRRLAGPDVCLALAASPACGPGCWAYVSSDVPDCVTMAAAELSAAGFAPWQRPGGGGGDSSSSTTGGGEACPRFLGGLAPLLDPSGSAAGEGVASNGAAGAGVGGAGGGLLARNPLGPGCGSEREAVCEQLWRKVYRILFTKP